MRKRLLKRLPGGIRVFEVDGPAVRRRHIQFVEGGHGQVYSFVPKREIWVEKMRSAADQKHILIHESVEHMLMRDFKWTYDRAHDAANAVEALERRRAARRA